MVIIRVDKKTGKMALSEDRLFTPEKTERRKKMKMLLYRGYG